MNCDSFFSSAGIDLISQFSHAHTHTHTHKQEEQAQHQEALAKVAALEAAMEETKRQCDFARRAAEQCNEDAG
jgi:hypothetical protein